MSDEISRDFSEECEFSNPEWTVGFELPGDAAGKIRKSTAM